MASPIHSSHLHHAHNPPTTSNLCCKIVLVALAAIAVVGALLAGAEFAIGLLFLVAIVFLVSCSTPPWGTRIVFTDLVSQQSHPRTYNNNAYCIPTGSPYPRRSNCPNSNCIGGFQTGNHAGTNSRRNPPPNENTGFAPGNHVLTQQNRR